MKTIASITPLPVSADTRTFKIAASFARFGYRSVVVEGEKSDLRTANLPFELRSRRMVRVSDKQTSGVRDNRALQNRQIFRQHLIQRAKVLLRPFQGALRPLFFLRWYFYNYNAGLASAMPKASLYYLHAPYQFPAVYWLSRRGSTALIYDAHDFYPVVSPSFFFKRLESWCIKNARAVVTVSEGVAKLMSKEFSCHPVVLRNCQDERLNASPAKDLREALELPRSAYLIVVVGQAKTGQAVRQAVAAMTTLPQKVHLTFVGKNTEKYQEMVNRYALQTRVHLVPPVKANEVVRFIRSADAALILYYPLSSNYENCLPNGFFQSVSAGLPLLYPELPEIKKLAEKYRLGIPVNPQSAESIRKAVMQLVEGPDIISKFKSNLRAANLSLSWEHEEKILYDLVKRVLNKSSESIL